jgi:hypothetical protein
MLKTKCRSRPAGPIHPDQSICGIALAENTQMPALGRVLGFAIQYESGSVDYKLRLDLRKNK